MWRLFIYFFTLYLLLWLWRITNSQKKKISSLLGSWLYLLHETNHLNNQPNLTEFVYSIWQTWEFKPCFWWNKKKQPKCNICEKTNTTGFFCISSAKFNTPTRKLTKKLQPHFVTEHSAVKLIQEFIPYQCYKIVKSFSSSLPTQNFSFLIFLGNREISTGKSRMLALNSFFLVLLWFWFIDTKISDMCHLCLSTGCLMAGSFEN